LALEDEKIFFLFTFTCQKPLATIVIIYSFAFIALHFNLYKEVM